MSQSTLKSCVMEFEISSADSNNHDIRQVLYIESINAEMAMDRESNVHFYYRHANKERVSLVCHL